MPNNEQERLKRLRELESKEMNLLSPDEFRRMMDFSLDDLLNYQEDTVSGKISKFGDKITKTISDAQMQSMGANTKVIDMYLENFKVKVNQIWEETKDKICNYQAKNYEKTMDKIKTEWKQIAGTEFPNFKTEDGREMGFNQYRRERNGWFYQRGTSESARMSPDIIEKMTDSQLKEISDGFRHGLTKEQIEIYANPEYDSKQMQQLREGLEKGLDVSQYANPSIPHDEMSEIRKSLEQGTLTPVKENNRSEAEKSFAIPVEDYSKEFSDKMTEALLKSYQVINKLGLNEHPKELLELTQKGIEMSKQGQPIPKEMVKQIDLYAFNDKQIEQIDLGLAHGLSKDDVAVYAKPKTPAERMASWRERLEKIKPWNHKESVVPQRKIDKDRSDDINR